MAEIKGLTFAGKDCTPIKELTLAGEGSYPCDIWKREISNEKEEIREEGEGKEFFEDFEDLRDRRAIDEEDDRDFFEELQALRNDVRIEDAYLRKFVGNYTWNMKFTNDGNEQDDDLSSRYSIEEFDPTLDQVVNGKLNVDDVIKRHRRIRRSAGEKKDTIEHVTKIMESIEEELDDLKQTHARHSITSQVTMPSKCSVLPEGGVNCSEAVYSDPNEWRISRRKIEQQIKKMRMQLETLKEIRRHLMIKRPQIVADTKEENVESEHSHVFPSSTFHKPHHHHQSRNHTNRHHQKHQDKSKTTNTVVTTTTTTTTPTTITEEISTIQFFESLSTVKETTLSENNVVKNTITTPVVSIQEKQTFGKTSDTTIAIAATKERKTPPKRHRMKETSLGNATGIDENKSPPQRRRKINKDQRKNNQNNTILTNSVHENVLTQGTVESTSMTVSTIATTIAATTTVTADRHRPTNSPTIITSKNVEIEETEEDMYKNRGTIGKLVTTTEAMERSNVNTVSTSVTGLHNAGETSEIESDQHSSVNNDNLSTTPANTIFPGRKLPKVHRNRTGAILGPARIDVTIVEPPDRKHKQGVTTTANNGRLSPILNSPLEARHKCYCEPDSYSKKDEKELAREERRRLKEERLKKKERKLKKKAKLEKDCLTEKMNCFEHDNDHWRTAPLWNAGPFCFCMNANNNTYSCLRTINVTHNFLYCEFTTGLVTFYNLRIDPFEQWNRVASLSQADRSYLHDQLEHLKGCKGTRDCTVGSARESMPQMQHHQKYMVKRKYTNTIEDSFVPSALQIIRESELGDLPNKRRKKLPNMWNRRNRSWQTNWRHHEDIVTNARRHRHQY